MCIRDRDMPAFFKNIPIAYPPGIPTTAVISNAIKVVKRPSIINACLLYTSIMELVKLLVADSLHENNPNKEFD